MALKKIKDAHLVARWVQTRDGALKRRIPFSLSLKKLRSLLQKEKCFYTGKKFDYAAPGMGMSIDRVDNEKGYTDDNVVACIEYYNHLKSNLTIEQILTMAKTIEKFIKKQANAKVPITTVQKEKSGTSKDSATDSKT